MPSRRLLLLLAPLLALTACSQGPSDSRPAAAAAETALLVSVEDLHVVRPGTLATGPAITGSIQPERRADLRAEVPAMVIEVLRENGDSVRRGDLLVRLDATAIRDALASAESARRAAAQSFDQASRQLERLRTLRASGMASAQAVDDAETRRNNAQSEVEAAKARLVSARQQLARTEVRAPFDGAVSDRKVSAGDTAQVGKELLKVIDPQSMRFEGLVSADRIGQVKAGDPVRFRVNGYGDQAFAGRVRRVNPAANPTTRQVEVLVDLARGQQPLLAGLYAEGRVEVAGGDSLTLPATALLRDGDQAFAWVVAQGRLRRVAVGVGERDPLSGEYALLSGLAAGDQVLRHPSALLRDGQAVETAGPIVPKARPAGG